MSINTILAICFLLIILFIIIKTMIVPLKAFFKLCYSCILSSLGIFGFNLIGGVIGLHVGLNIINIISISILGIPGLALILFLQILFRS